MGFALWAGLGKVAVLLAFLFPGASLSLANPIKVDENQRVVPYKLESVELTGSTRMTSEQIVRELGLRPGTPLDDELVMTARTRLLGLGLFRSAILLMRKGSEKGLAVLIVEVEDDDSVLTDWALGTTLGLTQSDRYETVGQENATTGYSIELIGRNIFNSLHRGSVSASIDSVGKLRKGHVAYGLPRFAREDIQFDAEIRLIDSRYFFLDTMGFGGKGQGLWSLSLEEFGVFRYGAAMYFNEKNDFSVPDFPRSIAGPKLVFSRETRLLSFIPGDGYAFEMSLLLSAIRMQHSVIEMNLAKTFATDRFGMYTLSTGLMSVGASTHSARAELRWDFPFTTDNQYENSAELFVRLRSGLDVIKDNHLQGSAAIVGLRYHSSGFIAELGFQLTKSPNELTPNINQIEDGW